MHARIRNKILNSKKFSCKFMDDNFVIDSCLLNKYRSSKPSLTGELSKYERKFMARKVYNQKTCDTYRHWRRI